MRLGVGQREVPGRAGRVLLDGDEHGDAAAVDVLAADQVAGALGRDHEHVDALGRGDVAEADVEAVAEDQRVAGDEVGLDRLGVELPLHVVGREDDDDVGLLARLGGREHAQALGLGLGPALGALGQADAHVDAGVAQGQRVRVALAAVAEHGHVLALDQGQVGVVVVEHLSHGGLLLRWWCVGSGGCCGRDGYGDRAQRALGDRAGAAADGDHAGLDELADAERLEHARAVASSLSALPVASIVTASGATSTTLARNSWTVSSTWPRVSASALTLTSSSSRCDRRPCRRARRS